MRDEVQRWLSACIVAGYDTLDGDNSHVRFEVDAPTLEALCRRWLAVEDAPCVPVIDGGMMIRPFFQYGRFDLPDDGENPATKEARLLGKFVGQRVRIVPEAGQGEGE